MNLNHAIIDLETNILNKDIGSNKASPFWPENDIVLGWFRKYYDVYGKLDVCLEKHSQSIPVRRVIVEELFQDCGILVGHNIKFDLLHIRQRYNELYLNWVKNGGMVWDTQIVEYLLSGQSHTYPSLDQCASKYGGTLKDDKIKEYWKNDIDTSDIPFEELHSYLEGDIDNTEIVFQKQWEIVEAEGMLPLVMSQMKALLALVEMEYNGLAFDESGAAHKATLLGIELSGLELGLKIWMESYLPKNLATPVTPSSPQQLSAVLFGGEVKVVEVNNVLDDKGLPVIFKSGKKKGEIKTRKTTKKVMVDGMGVIPTATLGKAGYYSTDDETLKKIITDYTHTKDIVDFCECVLKYRELAKDINTYYIGYSKLIFPDGLIHPNFNQCATSTGRLSSTNPNAQNLSRKEE